MSLVEFLKARLSFTLAEPAVILQEWTQTSSIKDLPFPSACLLPIRTGHGISFCVGGKSSNRKILNALTMEDRQILADLGNVLGSTGLQGADRSAQPIAKPA